MNEATLQARLHAILENVFPTFKSIDLKHEGSFSVKFGRRNVKVDLKDPSSYPNRAIYDVLLSSKGINLLLVELKEEGHDITNQDDINQGISYARLIDQMPPIVLVSNGKDTLFFDTYTKKEIKTTTIDFDFIQARIKTSFKLATAEFQNAVNFLLNKNPIMIGKVFRKISNDNFSHQSGTTLNVLKAISPEFQIYRKVTRRIYNNICRGHNLIGLVGHAFSGKTNVLYQIFRNYGFQRNNYVLYVNLKDWNLSIFQSLAVEFSKETKTNIQRDKVRDWLNSLIYSDAEARVILLIDNLTKDIRDTLFEEITELINIFKDTRHAIVYAVDEWEYKQLAHVEDRNYDTIIGDRSKCFYLRGLNAYEYRRMGKVLFKNGCQIQDGGLYSPEFREPRILRNIAAMIASAINRRSQAYAHVSAIPTQGMIKSVANNKIFNKAVHFYYKQLALMFVADESYRTKVPYLSVLAPTMGAISKSTYLAFLGKDEYRALIKSGVAAEREYIRGLEVILPKIPELFIYHIIDAVFFFLKELIEKEDYKEVYKEFIDKCVSFPDADIIGVGVLNKIGKFNIDLFTYLIQTMIEDEPKSEPIKAGTKTLMFSESYGYIQMNFESDMDEETMIAHHLPYNILSQLFHNILMSEDANGVTSNEHYIQMMVKIASFNGVMARIGFGSYGNMVPVSTWIIPDVGTVGSGRNGVTETIVQAIATIFLEDQSIVERMYSIGKEQKLYHLLWRIDLAMRSFTPNYPITVLSKAVEIMNGIRDIFFELFQSRDDN